MDERAAIDILTAKVQALEARLAELSSSDAGKVAAFGGEAAIKPTVDPKGRKIWESEWVMDHGALMCYVPDNALIIDGQNVAVESDDKEGSEVTLSGGSWYLHVFKSDETGEYSADFDDEPTGSREGDTAKYNIHICDINEKGYIEKQYVVGSIVINAKPSIVGETDDSEKIDGDVEVSGKLDQADNGTSCGIEFKTVSAREAQGTDPARPPRIIADIKGRHDEENGCDAETWGCHKLTIKGKDEDKIIHFLGCDDAIVVGEDGGGSGGGGAENVIGSDYIKVDDEEEEDDDGNVTTKRKVSAKIQTSDPNPSSPVEHALLTHDTDQLVRSKKTFLGSSPLANSKKVIIDGPNGRVEVKDATGNKTIKLDADDIPSDCGGELKVHKLKFKDENGVENTYHGLFCADIDLTKEGKLIKSTTVTASASPNGMNTIKFIYTDGTYDEFKVMNGMNGSPGSPGKDGDTPEITAERQGNHVYIYADGDLIATIEDGQTPQITAQRTGTKQTTIYANGIAIAVINDGEDGQGGSGGEPVEQEFISNIDFSVQEGKIVAYITKKIGKFIEVSEPEGDNPVEKTICEGTEVEVVTTSAYYPNTTGVNAVSFVNGRKKIHVISLADGTPQTVFTATKLSDEH